MARRRGSTSWHFGSCRWYERSACSSGLATMLSTDESIVAASVEMELGRIITWRILMMAEWKGGPPTHS